MWMSNLIGIENCEVSIFKVNFIGVVRLISCGNHKLEGELKSEDVS